MARPVEHVFAIRTIRGGDVRNACDYGYLNSVTVGDAFLISTIDEVLRDIDKGHVMRSATTFINQICCHANEVFCTVFIVALYMYCTVLLFILDFYV